MMSATIHEIAEKLRGQHKTSNKIIFLLCMRIHSYLSTKCAVVVTGSCNAMLFMSQTENWEKNSPKEIKTLQQFFLAVESMFCLDSHAQAPFELNVKLDFHITSFFKYCPW